MKNLLMIKFGNCWSILGKKLTKTHAHFSTKLGERKNKLTIPHTS
jgi:hypothetical protein